jgi:hypothetical protein
MRLLKWLLLASVCIGLAIVFPACSPTDEQIEQQPGRLLVFVQPGCPPCRKTERELASGGLSAPIMWVDLRDRPKSFGRWHVNTTPTYVLIGENGKVAARKVGYQTPGQLQRWLDQHR